MKLKMYTPNDKLSSVQRQAAVDFLYTHLDEYGDEKVDIEAAIAYAMQDSQSPGGYVILNSENDVIIGAVVVNKTGMSKYIPENILVYIAMHGDYRGRGIGRKLMEMALEFADGDMALHVEPNNPAKFLYEKLGFENKYLEMRHKR